MWQAESAKLHICAMNVYMQEGISSVAISVPLCCRLHLKMNIHANLWKNKNNLFSKYWNYVRVLLERTHKSQYVFNVVVS